jgi:hypothetical protein
MYIIPIDSLLDNYLEDNDKLFLLVVALHYNKIIDDAKFAGKMKSLREGKLNRRINTYHCNINNEWYSDDRMVNVLEDVWIKSKVVKNNIPLKTFLIYINKLLNKPQNYCVNYCYTQFIKPIVERYNVRSYGSWDNDFYYNDNCIKLIDKFGFNLNVVTFSKFEMNNYCSGYCCEDCDGPYESYRNSQYEYNYLKQNLINLKKEIFNVLNTFRTKDYLKNPNRVILT